MDIIEINRKNQTIGIQFCKEKRQKIPIFEIFDSRILSKLLQGEKYYREDYKEDNRKDNR